MTVLNYEKMTDVSLSVLSGFTMEASAHLGCSLLSIKHRTEGDAAFNVFTYKLGADFSLDSTSTFTPTAQGGLLYLENMTPDLGTVNLDSDGKSLTVEAQFTNYATDKDGGLLLSLRELTAVTLEGLEMQLPTDIDEEYSTSYYGLLLQIISTQSQELAVTLSSIKLYKTTAEVEYANFDSSTWYDSDTFEAKVIQSSQAIGVFVQSAMSLTLVTADMELKKLEFAEFGSALTAIGSTVSWTDSGSVFENNYSYQGGAVYLMNPAALSLTSTQFTQNIATNGGAIHCKFQDYDDWVSYKFTEFVAPSDQIVLQFNSVSALQN